MEHAPSTVETDPHAADHGPDAHHDVAHGDAFYAASNPKFFGLPLGVLIAGFVALVSIAITIVKFLGSDF